MVWGKEYFFCMMDGGVTPPKKMLKTQVTPVGICPENHSQIGSAVSEILRDRYT